MCRCFLLGVSVCSSVFETFPNPPIPLKQSPLNVIAPWMDFFMLRQQLYTLKKDEVSNASYFAV